MQLSPFSDPAQWNQNHLSNGIEFSAGTKQRPINASLSEDWPCFRSYSIGKTAMAIAIVQGNNEKFHALKLFAQDPLGELKGNQPNSLILH
jgi:hypothetical protein